MNHIFSSLSVICNILSAHGLPRATTESGLEVGHGLYASGCEGQTIFGVVHADRPVASWQYRAAHVQGAGARAPVRINDTVGQRQRRRQRERCAPFPVAEHGPRVSVLEDRYCAADLARLQHAVETVRRRRERVEAPMEDR